MNGAATTQSQQPLEDSLTPNVYPYEHSDLRTNTTDGDTRQCFSHRDLASFLPSEPTHNAQTTFGPESQQAWGMYHAIALQQQNLGMLEEGNQHQEWERDWAVEKAIPLLQQRQENNAVPISHPLSLDSGLSWQSLPTMDDPNPIFPQILTQEQLQVEQEWGLGYGVFMQQH